MTAQPLRSSLSEELEQKTVIQPAMICTTTYSSQNGHCFTRQRLRILYTTLHNIVEELIIIFSIKWWLIPEVVSTVHNLHYTTHTHYTTPHTHTHYTTLQTTNYTTHTHTPHYTTTHTHMHKHTYTHTHTHTRTNIYTLGYELLKEYATWFQKYFKLGARLVY